MDDITIESVDGELFEVARARQQARRYFFAGFALLPLFWAVNVWLFWPSFRGAGPAADPVVKKYTRYSAVGLAVSTALLLPWTLAFAIGGPAVLGDRIYGALDAGQFDIWGAMTGGA